MRQPPPAPTTPSPLHQSLSDYIAWNHWELMWNTNIALQTLFRGLGSHINCHLANFYKEVKFDTATLSWLTECLRARFGAYFEQTSLADMMVYSIVSSNMERGTNTGISFIGWEYTPMLLSQPEAAAWQFYIKNIIKQRLTPEELREQLSSDLFGRSTERKRPKRKKAFQKQAEFEIANKPVISNLYKAPILSVFKSLMEPKEIGVSVSGNDTQTEAEHIFNALLHHITKAQGTLARSLNSKFNLFLQGVGQIINHHCKDETGEEIEAVIEELAGHLVEKFGQIFIAENLKHMVTCATKFNDFSIFIRLADLLTWGHILLLLPLTGPEEILFYAEFTAANSLSTDGLYEAIKTNTYKNTGGVIEKKQHVVDNAPSPFLKKQVTKEGNNILVTTTWYGSGKYVEKDESKTTVNLFANPYFMAFMAGE